MDDVSGGVSDMSAVLSGECPSALSDKTDDSTSTAADMSSDDVHSRLSMSDEQREIKRRFEEKQCDEARRSAQAERVAKKKVNL